MKRRNGGFSILEALVAGFVLTLVLVTVLNLLPASLLSIGRGRHILAGTTLARSIVEERRAAGYEQFDVAPTLRPVPDDGTVYTPYFQVIDVSTRAHAGRVKGIRVLVLWQEHGQVRSVSHEEWMCHVPI